MDILVNGRVVLHRVLERVQRALPPPPAHPRGPPRPLVRQDPPPPPPPSPSLHLHRRKVSPTLKPINKSADWYPYFDTIRSEVATLSDDIKSLVKVMGARETLGRLPGGGAAAAPASESGVGSAGGVESKGEDLGSAKIAPTTSRPRGPLAELAASIGFTARGARSLPSRPSFPPPSRVSALAAQDDAADMMTPSTSDPTMVLTNSLAMRWDEPPQLHKTSSMHLSPRGSSKSSVITTAVPLSPGPFESNGTRPAFIKSILSVMRWMR